MTTGFHILRSIVFVLAGACVTLVAQAQPATTSGAIAVANLDYLLAQANEPARRVELLLARSRFLGDYEALDQAVAISEGAPLDGEGLLLRARTRAAAHRFDEALADLRAAGQAGADHTVIDKQRAAILIATGQAFHALAVLERGVALRPGYASHSALANAYAEIGRYREAELEYRRALADLRTTSPFPYAWIHFALGLMWAEQAGDTLRGEAEYDLALSYLPEFVTATVHKAELELRRGDWQAAQARLLPIARSAREPEALALLGEVQRHAGQERQARQNIALAQQRYGVLLQRQPLAFADHAAEFYLGVGANPDHAWQLAMRNLGNRRTPRAFSIAMRSAIDSGRDVCGLIEQMAAAFDVAAAMPSARAEWERRATTGVTHACAGRHLPDRR